MVTKFVIALEGGDGSGKGQVRTWIEDYCHSHNVEVAFIDRSGVRADSKVASLTRFLQDHEFEERDDEESQKVDIHTRIAREYLRSQVANALTADMIVLDRFVLSIRARIAAAGIHVPGADEAFLDLVKLVGLSATILCDCDSSKSWERVIARAASEGLSPKERRGEAFNRRLTQFLRMQFEEGELTGARWPVRTDQALDASRADLFEYFSALGHHDGSRHTRRR